jgi:hypothetical protein
MLSLHSDIFVIKSGFVKIYDVPDENDQVHKIIQISLDEPHRIPINEL